MADADEHCIWHAAGNEPEQRHLERARHDGFNPTNGTVFTAGTNTLSVVYTPTDTNYAATNLSVELVVTPAPLSVTASNVSRVYGQPNPVFGGTINGIQNGDDITANYATGATAVSPIGGYSIVPTLWIQTGVW